MNNNKKNPIISNRAAKMVYLFILLFFLLTARILFIQWDKEVQGHALQVLGEEKWTKEYKLYADRGIIYDRNGIEIAKDVSAYTIIAVLKDGGAVLPIKDPYDAASKLAPVLGMSISDLTDRLSNNNAYQVELGPKGRKISFTKKKEIEALKIQGISFMKETRRLYPNNKFASHVIGYTTINKEDESKRQKGVMGIEAFSNNYLIETNGTISFRTDKKGFKLPDPHEMIDPPQNGDSIYLTIDQKIQTFVEHALNKVEQEFAPEKVIAIVADAKTGRILAMSNRPSFDPNIRDITNWTNYAISARFEPGSTMKIFTLAAAIEEEMFFPNHTFKSGRYAISGDIIRDHNNGKGWGEITFLEGVQRSSNVGFSILAEQVGATTLMNYYQEFGLTRKTGIDLPNEVNSTFKYDYPLEQVSTAWGQGSAITPIQQVQAATAITNNGEMMKPFIIDRIVDKQTGEIVVKNKPEVAGNPISASTAKEVRDILETVITSPNGTGKSYFIKGYQVAGKTGTAQIFDPKTGRYLKGWGNNIYSFLGFAPKDDPQLIVYVAVDRPQVTIHELGSKPVSNAFKMIMKSSLQYLDIDPINELGTAEEIKKNETVKINNYEGKHINEAMSHLKALGLQVIRIGSGDKVKEQLPRVDSVVLSGEKVLLYVGGNVKMPNIYGWSKRDVLKLCALLQLKPNMSGSGYVTKQNIPPQSKLKVGSYLVVQLESNVKKNKENVEEQLTGE